MTEIKNPLTSSEINELLTRKQSKPAPLTRYMLISDGHTLTKDRFVPAAVGRYEGKTGSKRRTRKGRTMTLPNGRRQYIHGDQGVIAYKA